MRISSAFRSEYFKMYPRDWLTRKNYEQAVKRYGSYEAFRIIYPHIQTIGSDKKDKKVLAAIKSIEKRGAITCNDTWGTYHVKYGGSVDVDALINMRIHVEFDINEFALEINQSLPLAPVLAKAHYAKTGTIRYFVQKYNGEDFNLGDEYKNSTDPTIYHVLYKSEKVKQSIIDGLEQTRTKDVLPNGTILYFIKIVNIKL